MNETDKERRQRDLDETRRLLYMTLYASHTDLYEIVGTTVNALAHHGSNIPASESAPNLLAVANHENDTAKAEDWVNGQIDRITKMLKDENNPDHSDD